MKKVILIFAFLTALESCILQPIVPPRASSTTPSPSPTSIATNNGCAINMTFLSESLNKIQSSPEECLKSTTFSYQRQLKLPVYR